MDSNESIAKQIGENTKVELCFNEKAQEFQERVEKTLPDFLKAFIEDDKETLANYELEFKKNAQFGVRVLWTCIHEVQDNKDKYENPDDLVKRLRYFKRYFAIASKMNIYLIPESDDPAVFKFHQHELLRMIDGMSNITNLMCSWAAHFDICNHEENALKDDAVIMRRRSDLLYRNLRVLRSKIFHATTITELNDVCHEFIMLYVTKYPSNFSTVIKRK